MIELPQDIDLINPEFLKLWDLIRHTHQSVFLTGKAGTGKSTFLRYICEHTKKNHIILAPTGIAAMNVGGVTLHSFFQIPMRPVPPDDSDYSVKRIQKKLKFSKEKIKVIKNLDLLIIDEISMVRADTIDFIDRTLRSYRNRPREPFGGCQLLLVGDIFQLEPVVTSDVKNILSYYYKNSFFFNAKVYEEMELVAIELQKVYRQKNSDYVALLDRVRLNKATAEDLSLLNTRYDSNPRVSFESSFTITLAARRETVDNINARELDILPGSAVVVKGAIKGDFPDKLLPTEMELSLKPGAQVLFVKNDKDKRWVNGTLARIHSISDLGVSVELESGETHTVEPELWENVKYTFNEQSRRVEENVLGTFSQLPLKPAWALTVHKSQGLTFNRVIIDLGDGAFAGGQTYVALSRCTSLEGITLSSRLKPRDIIVNPAVVEFARKFNDEEAVSTALNGAKADECYLSSLKSFEQGEYLESVADLARAIGYRNDLNSPKVQRFIASRLGMITRLQSEVESMRSQLKKLACEYVDMGGECLAHEDMIDAAIANFEKALSLDAGNEDARIGKAQAYFAAKRFDDTHSIVKEILSRNKKCWEAHVLAAQCYQAQEDAPNALLRYGAALAINKRNPDLHDAIADLLESLDLMDQAYHHRSLAAKYRKTNRK